MLLHLSLTVGQPMRHRTYAALHYLIPSLSHRPIKFQKRLYVKLSTRAWSLVLVGETLN